MIYPPDTVLRQFFPEQQPEKITPLGNGLINDTFLLHFPEQYWVLQRINQYVFPYPEKIIHNLIQLQAHLSNQESSLKIPALLVSSHGSYLAYDDQQAPWRVMEFIEDSESRETISSLTEAGHVGQALAQFHRQFQTLEIKTLHDSLPGFHNTPGYLKHYDQVVRQKKSKPASQKLTFGQEFIENYRDKATLLENARQQGILKQRVTHGDPKLNNFLFKQNSPQIIALIDLDTVKPNLIHYDIADCVRSCCQTPHHQLDLDLAKQLLEHYLHQAKPLLSCADIDYLYPALELVPFELGLRFLTDYLENNRYFKVDYPDQNLDRAINQFLFCSNIQQHCQELKAFIQQAQ
jgi:Ser/Thr protein kinase RdoA (MazF antagonist)